MASLDISSKTALILLNTDGTDDPDQLVGVAAAELFEWAWLIGELAGWLEDADEHTRADFDRFFSGYRTADKTAWFAAHIAERIAALLDGDRGHHDHHTHTVGTTTGCRVGAAAQTDAAAVYPPRGP